ncbi:MAG: beta-ketoacyl-ACP synthase 3 [Thermoguttaceae bacterium]|jgi:3-oxoacyl-[acyl-carrier-protein] synthase-3
MEAIPFRMPLYLPAQGASETEATIIEWRVSEGDRFQRGQILAQVDSAKSVFDFEAPCSGLVIRVMRVEGETVPLVEPVLEIETNDPAMREWIPPAAGRDEVATPSAAAGLAASRRARGEGVVIQGVGGYLPSRVVTNAELVKGFPELTDQYVYEVTGIRQRRWADDDERPSAMAFKASLEAIRNSGLDTRDIDAIIVATTTPDMAIPSTAAILQERLSLPTVPAFDLNAACSGWLYGVAIARGMILSGLARHVLTVGVEMQSRLLDAADRNAYFLFGDGAGAAIISGGVTGHRIRHVQIGGDSRGIHMARREAPGYLLPNGHGVDPWIRIDGHALFRFATESFSLLIRQSVSESGWKPEDTRWVIPHQANGRILKAAAKRSGIPFDRFFLNVENVGNTSSASIPLALTDIQRSLRPDDKLVLCSVGAGMTTAAISVEW